MLHFEIHPSFAPRSCLPWCLPANHGAVGALRQNCSWEMGTPLSVNFGWRFPPWLCQTFLTRHRSLGCVYLIFFPFPLHWGHMCLLVWWLSTLPEHPVTLISSHTGISSNKILTCVSPFWHLFLGRPILVCTLTGLPALGPPPYPVYFQHSNWSDPFKIRFCQSSFQNAALVSPFH